MERVAPRQLLYENQLPIAIESTSTRRIFFPEGGAKYGPPGAANPNIVRIPINADDMLDCQESFLQFKLNNTATAGETVGPDFGVPFIRRLRIESGGTTLEDINEYGKLYAQLYACQASSGAATDATLTTAGALANNGALTAVADINRDDTGLTNAAAGDGLGAGKISSAIVAAIAAGAGAGNVDERNFNQPLANAIKAAVDAYNATSAGRTVAVNGANVRRGALGNGASVYYNIPLVSGLLNMSKYLPLVMMNAGLTIELEFDTAPTVGAWNQDNATINYEIENVRYIAHMISLQRDFYDKLRLVMEGSGGVLQLAGTTYRHFTGVGAAAANNHQLSIPAKIKSIKGILFTQQATTDKETRRMFGVSNSHTNAITSYQFRVGSVSYPPTPVRVDKVGDGYINKGEAYQELRKLFGTLGDYQHGGVLLNNRTYLTATNAVCNPGNDAEATTAILNPFGLSFESFPRTALESGVNSADRNLNISLEIDRTGGTKPAGDVRLDAWCMSDAIFYVNLDGSVSVSV